MKLADAYQDQYLEAAGLPVNLMEVLAITLVFERRVINQYAKHLAVPDLRPEVKETIERIMAGRALARALGARRPGRHGGEVGKDNIAETLRRYKAADREVYAHTLAEHESRLGFLLESRPHPVED